MKTASIVAGIVFLTVVSLISPVYAGRGGGGRGGGGGGAVSAGGGGGGGAKSAGGAGGRAISGAGRMGGPGGVRGYSIGPGNRVYSGNGRIYSARQVNSVYGGNVVRGSTVVRSSSVKGSTVHSARSSNLTSHRIQGKQTASNLKSGSVHTTRNHSETNRVHRMDSAKQSRNLTASNSVGKKGRMSSGAISARPGKLARNNPANKNRFGPQTQARLRNWQGKKSDFAEANRRHKGDGNHNHNGHCHHDHDWWHHHCNAIILVDSGWWGWWDGWWYPAWGYDPYYSAYDYDGPIYDYGGLPPDEVVANVQAELQRLGYFSYAVDGVLGPLTQNALMRYQSDRRIPVTGAVDPATVGSLGLSSTTFSSTSG